jgi:hypothetical protein
MYLLRRSLNTGQARFGYSSGLVVRRLAPLGLRLGGQRRCRAWLAPKAFGVSPRLLPRCVATLRRYLAALSHMPKAED